MVPCREKAHFEPQPWDEDDETLPGKCERGGYFLRAGAGRRYVVGGTVVRALATRAETDGKFSIYELLASSLHASKSFSVPLNFKETHHAIYVLDGTFTLSVDGSASVASVGETVFVPAGMEWRVEAESRFARAYVFANGGGLGEALSFLGSEFGFPGVPDDAMAFDEVKLKGLQEKLGFSVSNYRDQE